MVINNFRANHYNIDSYVEIYCSNTFCKIKRITKTKNFMFAIQNSFIEKEIAYLKEVLINFRRNALQKFVKK